MARYYFNLHDGHSVIDDEGTELVDIEAARRLAAEFLGAAVRDAGLALFGDDDFRLEVTDERGLILFSVHVMPCDGAAPRRLARNGGGALAQPTSSPTT